MSFGFIVLRHVNSDKTNKYWNQCVKLLRTNYPNKRIIIIDDHSNYAFVKPDFNYKKVRVIQSKYSPGKGELLPYIYYLDNPQWFENAVFIHDSVFIHKRIPFERFHFPVIPLWHFNYDQENLPNLIRISSYLKNNNMLKSKLIGDQSNVNVLGMSKNYSFYGIFGVQTFINHSFLQNMQSKYNIKNLLNAVHNRTDRCGLERIMGVIFATEYKPMILYRSILGNILVKQVPRFGYNYDNYENDLKNKRVHGPIIKVWTGR